MERYEITNLKFSVFLLMPSGVRIAIRERLLVKENGHGRRTPMPTATRVMEIATPLGEGALLFHGMRGREELGRLSEYHLDLLSADGEVDVDAILGKNVTIKLALPDNSARYFNGYVTRFSQGTLHGRYYQYTATVHPWLWFLTRTSDCRIFQEMTVPDIIKKVFADHGTADYALELTSTYRKWTYCVQYRETDFNFVSRLMEQEGIYYYFRHTDGHNTLVLTDSCSKHVPSPGYEEIPYVPPDRLVRPELEHVSRWEFSREIQPGVYVHKDYDLERPSVDLKTQKVLARKYTPSNYEIFDYPGEYLQKADGEQYAAIRIDEYGTQFEIANAVTNARGIAVGALFTLDACPRADQNREHLVVAANYELEFSDYEALGEGGGTRYLCGFRAMSTQQQFRPLRTTSKPFVQGPQTAMVVGPAGDEIYTDQFGRVKVQFHWDRLGKRDENSSCWIRVSQPWAGKGWGGVSTPRIGQEVIVDFLEGDPDQPIITGRVYNAESQPPFGFPAGAVVSGIKSSTHKGSGYNELSMDDTAGKEKITIHGQYDMNTTVEHDQTTTVKNNRTDNINVNDSETVGGNQKIHVVGSQTVAVDVNRGETVGGTETITITGHRSETVNGGEDVTVNGTRGHTVNGLQTTTISLAEMHSVGAGRMHNVGAAESIQVGGAQLVNVGAVQSVNVGGAQIVKVGALQTVTVAGPHKLSAAVINETSKGPVKIKAGATAMIEAPTIILKAGSSKIIMTSSGITIKAAKVNVKSNGTVTLNGSGGIKLKGPSIGEN
jgi:type VI secretion system secreted protein VgrG